jgi:hypothetical protein
MTHPASTHPAVPARRAPAAQAPGATTRAAWEALTKASFAVLSYTTPSGEPRSSGVIYAVHKRHLFVAVARDSWKARHIADGRQVAVTVPVRRGGLLSLIFPIPPATISFHARVDVHPPRELDLDSLSKALARLLPEEGRDGSVVLELVPEGEFLTYGIGMSLSDMRKPALAKGHAPVA